MGPVKGAASDGQRTISTEKRKLTKRTVDAIGAAGTKFTIWDSELPGFGLQVTPKGVKTFVAKYRAKNQQRWLTLGRYGRITPEEARRLAVDAFGAVARGEDPSDQRRSARQAPTLAELCDRFIEEHVDAHLKPQTAKAYQRLITLHIRPMLGAMPVRDITTAEVARLHQGLKKTPFLANRVMSVLSKMLNLACTWGLRPMNSNPCPTQARFKERKRERFLGPEELKALGDELRSAESNQLAGPYAVAAIRLLLFTGARLGEILGLRWEFVDMDGATIRLPDSKTGAKSIYLNGPALEVLRGLQRELGNPYVIVGAKRGAPLVNLAKPWNRIKEAITITTQGEVYIEDLRIHDLRHSFASVGAASHLGLPVIGALLGHTQASTTQRYAHIANDPLRAASEAIGLKIAEGIA